MGGLRRARQLEPRGEGCGDGRTWRRKGPLQGACLGPQGRAGLKRTAVACQCGGRAVVAVALPSASFKVCALRLDAVGLSAARRCAW